MKTAKLIRALRTASGSSARKWITRQSLSHKLATTARKEEK
ncbi:MAG: hypothetical protein N2V75_05505 [Methanophagales archaeon]|nr:hypothetical protein [Methanophagales archaeon]